jgi:hypothetical protein
MPTGLVKCRYVGGPFDGNTLELAAKHCRQTMEVDSEAWAAEDADGGMAMFKGPLGPNWTRCARYLYQKEPRRPSDGGATYRYVRTIEVRRCADVLEDEGRRCKNEALPNSDLCRGHEKRRPLAV